MNIHILQSSEISHAKEIWTSLEREDEYVPFNALWNYIETWISVFGKEVPHWFLYGEEKGNPYGIVLLVKEVGRDVIFPIKGFTLGPDGENYTERVGLARNSILARKQYTEVFVEALFSTINKEFKWEEINLDGFVDDEVEIISNAFDKIKLTYSLKKE